WLCRFAFAGAVGFGTWAGFVAIAGFGFDGSTDPLVVLIVLGVLAGLAAHTLRERSDVFPLAAIAASLIVLSSTAIAKYASFDDVDTFFILSAWLIAS